jgi:glyoxylase I family protein
MKCEKRIINSVGASLAGALIYLYFYIMLKINKVHHIAIICTDYPKSKDFYTHVLSLEIIRETFRSERNSYKLDLALNGEFIIELFSFPSAPARITLPEAAGLRHLAFETDNLLRTCESLSAMDVYFEAIRTDTLTGKKFTFIFDPDGLPIEFYEK